MRTGIARFDQAQYGFYIVPVCQGKIQHQDFYTFVAIEPQDYDYFKKHYKHGEGACFNAYGTELLRGWGHAPSDDILRHMKLKHGIEFDVDKQFIDRLIAQVTATTNDFPFPLKPAKAS